MGREPVVSDVSMTAQPVLLPHVDLVPLLCAAGEGRATLDQLGVASAAVFDRPDRDRDTDVSAVLDGRWPLGTPPWTRRLLTGALEVIQQAEHRVMVSGGAGALVALVAGERVAGMLIGPDGVRLRVMTGAELAESVVELVRLTSSADGRWTVARWSGADLVASAAGEPGDVTVTAADSDLRLRIARTATVPDLVEAILDAPPGG